MGDLPGWIALALSLFLLFQNQKYRWEDAENTNEKTTWEQLWREHSDEFDTWLQDRVMAKTKEMNEEWRKEDLERRQDELTPKLRVTVDLGYEAIPGVGVGAIQYACTIVNYGLVDVYPVTPQFFQLPNQTRMYPGATQRPSTCGVILRNQESCTFYFGQEVVKRRLQEEGFEGAVSLKAAVRDQAGNLYFSEPFDVQVTELVVD